MEWWENDGCEPVDEEFFRAKNGLYRAGSATNNVGFLRKKNEAGQSGTELFYNRNGSGKKAFVTDKQAKTGAAVVGGLAAGAALKYGVSKFRANKAKQAQAQPAQQQNAQGQQAAECGTNCEGFSWIEDPGAQHIMEGYFSEFADADMYDAPEPHPCSDNEWDA